MSEKPKKKGLVFGLAIGLPILIVGVVVGLGMSGIVKIPGLTPKKKTVAVAAKPADKPKVIPPKKPKAAPIVQKPKPLTPVADPARGASAIATIWNEMEAPKLVELAKEYKDPQLARIMSKMDSDKVAEILAGMAAKRAASISKELEKLGASLVKEG